MQIRTASATSPSERNYKERLSQFLITSGLPPPGILFKLRGKVYSKGKDEKGDNTGQRVPISIKGKNLI